MVHNLSSFNFKLLRLALSENGVDCISHIAYDSM
jgi:hypothetical protein